MVRGRRRRRDAGGLAFTRPPSLPTGALRIGLRLVDDRPVVEVRDRERDVVDELRRAPVWAVAQVLRLVGHLVVVAVTARREEDDRDAVAGVHVVVAAAVDVLRM